MFANVSSKGGTARSFGGLRMTKKWEDVIPENWRAVVLPCMNKNLCHVNHPLIVILRRPQDDKKVGGCHPMFAKS
jgi:hypothetical protein